MMKMTLMWILYTAHSKYRVEPIGIFISRSMIDAPQKHVCVIMPSGASGPAPERIALGAFTDNFEEGLSF